MRDIATEWGNSVCDARKKHCYLNFCGIKQLRKVTCGFLAERSAYAEVCCLTGGLLSQERSA